MGRTVTYNPENRREHTAYGRNLPAVRITCRRQCVIVSKQFVCSVDEMDFQARSSRDNYMWLLSFAPYRWRGRRRLPGPRPRRMLGVVLDKAGAMQAVYLTRCSLRVRRDSANPCFRFAVRSGSPAAATCTGLRTAGFSAQPAKQLITIGDDVSSFALHRHSTFRPPLSGGHWLP